MSVETERIRLLMYGYDPVLLETRRAILLQAGCDTCMVADPRKFKGAIESAPQPYDLVVICHTVQANERKSISSLAAQRHIPVFQIEGLIRPQSLLSEVSRVMGPLKPP